MSPQGTRAGITPCGPPSRA
uniref:Uncharacterized protein n=1 Tax=Arundo donax TaxID=35708 RepID=A0A0A9ANN5_ARUDO